jgi:uncharacterized protein (TIGR02001 family)
MNKKTLLASALLTTVAVPAVSMAEVSANIGWVSEYIFRGIYQEDSSASGGIDYASDSGFYIGTWGADVGNGLETDLYFGYSGGDDFTYSIGFTGYYYTDDWDDTYTEVNLGIGYGIFALDVAVGEWDGFGTPLDYTFTSITLSPEKGPYYKIGTWGQDYDGTYLEVGYAFDFMGVDLSIAATYSPDGDDPFSNIILSQDNVFAETALVFGISKGFSIGE